MKTILSKALLACVLLIHTPFVFAFTIEVSEAELQQKLSAAMPFEMKKYLMTVILSEPTIELGTDVNEIHVITHVDVIAPGGKSGSGRVKIKGPIHYDPGVSSFFLKDPVVEELEIDKLPMAYTSSANLIVQTLVTKALAKHPVYTLSGDGFKNSLAKTFLKSVSIENSKLILLF